MEMQLFQNLFTSTSNTAIRLEQLLVVLGVSLLLGLILAVVYRYRSQYSREFVVTIALLPTLIAMMVFLVNGNLGTGVAVAGAFSLIRFRSAAGSAKDLLLIFLATIIGLATGMGYVTLAVAFTVMMALALLVFSHLSLLQVNERSRYLIVTVDSDCDEGSLVATLQRSACKQVDLLSITYQHKKERLVLEYLLTLNQSVNDQQLVSLLMSHQPHQVMCSRHLPKKKHL